MRLDGKSDPAPVRGLARFFQRGLDRLEYAEQPAVEDLIEDGLLGVEIIVDARSLDLGRGRDLAEGRGRVTLAAEQLGRGFQNLIA